MRRNPKKGRLVWIGVAAVLVGAGAVAAPFFPPVDRYRPLLEQYLTSSTGRRVEIGSLRLSLWPRVHVHATDLRLLNPAGFPAGNAIEARAVDLGVDPRALLAGRLEIHIVTITDVHATLLIDAAGRTNYDALARSAPSAAAGARPPISLAPIGAVSIDDVALAVRTVDLHQGTSTALAALTGLNVAVGLSDPNAADWATRLKVTANLAGVRIVTPFLRAPVAVQSGTLALRGGRGTATFAVALGSLRASGKAAIAGLSTPAVTFTLAIPALDAAALQRLMGPLGSAPPPAGPQPLIARGALDIGRITAGPFRAAQAHSTLSIYRDRIRAEAYQLSAYGGTVRGSALFAFAQRALPSSGTAVVRGVNLAALLRAAAPRNPGPTGTLDADLAGSTALGGGNPLAALAGRGTFVVRNGTLKIPGQFALAAKPRRLNVPSGAMPFRAFGGDVRITRERIYSNTLRLDASAMSATVHGSVGFDQTLDYAGVGALTLGPRSSGLSPAALLSRLLPEPAGATAASAPFSLRGSIGNPTFALTGAPRLIHGPATGSPQTPPAPDLPSSPQSRPPQNH